MNASLRALCRDPRFAASATTILLLLTDDVPQPLYGTFHDPGGALLLSIIYGNCVGLIVARHGAGFPRWGWSILLTAGLCLKYVVQAFLYIENAEVVDAVLLVVSHAGIAAAASRDGREMPVLTRIGVGSVVLVAFLFLLNRAGDYAAANKPGFARGFFVYAAARAVVPYAFWTAVLASARFNAPAD